MTAQTTDFSGLLFYNPAGPGFNPVISATLNLLNTGPINEGDQVDFELVTWGIPDGTTLYYRIVGLSNMNYNQFTDVNDSVVITRNRGYFSVGIVENHLTAPGTQTFDIVIERTLGGGGEVTRLAGITVNDTSQGPTYSIVPDTTTIDEGGTIGLQTVTYSITTTNVADGTRLYWTNSGTTNAADIGGSNSGYVDISGGSASLSLTATSDATTETSETIIIKLRTVSVSGTIVATADTVTVGDTSQSPVPYLSNETINTIVIPGTPGNLSFLYHNFTGQSVYYSILFGEGVSAENFSSGGDGGLLDGPLTGDGYRDFSGITANSTLTTNWQYQIKLGSTVGGDEWWVSNAITVWGAPTAYEIATAGAVTSINEGSSLTFNVSGTNITDGTYYWTVTNSGDFGTSSGSFSITSNSGSFSVTPTADATTEGSETFTASIRSGSTSGTVLATSSSVTINDTSTNPTPSIPTGSIVGRWNNPGEFGGDPVIWSDSTGLQLSKFYHLAGFMPADNGTYGYSGDSTTSYVQTPIHMTGGEFTFAFTARLIPSGPFPKGIFDCSQPSASTGLRAYWSDATHIVITSPGTGPEPVDMTGSGWVTYGPSFFTVRMKLDNIANTGTIDIFVNGTAWANIASPRANNGFTEASGVNMILGALVNNVGDKVGSLDSAWFNFIYYSRALSNSEVTQLYTAQQAKLLAPAPPTTYSFESITGGTLPFSNITLYLGVGSNTIPPNNMYGWTVTGPGISSGVTVSSNTTITNDTQFTIPLDSSIIQGNGTYTFTKP